MRKVKRYEDFFNELISLNQEQIILLMTKDMRSSFNPSRCKIIHTLTHKDNEDLSYHFKHRGVQINSLGQETLAGLLYRDLTKIAKKGKELRSKNIELLLALNGLGLPYLGHGDYLNDNGYLDTVLSLPNMLLDMKREYKIK